MTTPDTLSAILALQKDAKRCGIGASYLSDIELDRRPCPSDAVLESIAREVGVPKAELFRLRDEPMAVAS